MGFFWAFSGPRKGSAANQGTLWPRPGTDVTPALIPRNVTRRESTH